MYKILLISKVLAAYLVFKQRSNCATFRETANEARLNGMGKHKYSGGCISI